MTIFKSMLLTGTILGLGLSASASANATGNTVTTITTTTTESEPVAPAAPIAPSVPADAVKIDTQTDITTDKVFNDGGEIVATKVEKTTTDTYKFDVDNNGFMDENEYITHSYTLIDIDGDGYVDDVEWNKYTSMWYEPVAVKYSPETQTFISYDLDGDGRIDMTEYKKAYDVKIYQAWDANKDGHVDINEYKTVTTTYHTLDKEDVYKWNLNE